MTYRIPSSPEAAAAAALVLALASPSVAAAQAGPYGRMIVFGDSISDSGTYADDAPPGAGRFTTNPDPVWVEQIAAAWGLPLSSAVAGGLNFAEGGARVAEPRPGAPGDLSRLPVVDQIDAFLAAGAFRPDDLVVIQGGGNDVFHTQTNGLDFTPSDHAILEKAAGDLAEAVAGLSDAGAKWVVTTSVPEFEVFNAYYREALGGSGANALYFDAARLIAELKADPSTYGLVNLTDPACRGSAVQSFRCLPEDLVTPDANRTYLMADRVHFTGAVHQMKAQAALSLIDAVHQADATVRVIDASRPAAADWLTVGPGGGFVGVLEGRKVETTGVREAGADIAALRVGLTRRVGSLGLGLGLSVEDAEGGVGTSADLGWRSVALAGTVERAVGPVRLRLDGAAGALDDVTLSRRIVVGPANRAEFGETSGRTASLSVTLSGALGSPALRLEPWTSLGWTRTQLDGWSEAGENSTTATFGDLTHDRAELGLGLRAAFAPVGGGWWPHAALSVYTRVSGDEAEVVLTPAGAPLAFEAPAPDGDETRSRLEAGLSRAVGEGGRVSVSGAWTPTGPWDETGLRLQMTQSF